MNKYHAIDQEKLVDDNPLFISENLYFHINDILGANFYPPTNVELIENMPLVAKNIWYCWGFQAEIGASESIYDYLVNKVWPAKEIAFTIRALEDISALELTNRLKSGITLSKHEGVEFWRENNLYGLDNLTIDPLFDSFEKIDFELHSLINEKLTAKMVTHIGENKHDL